MALKNPRLKRVVEAFWAGGVARINPEKRGTVEIDGMVFRVSVIGDLLRIGLIEVDGALSWRGKTCPLCGGCKPPSFACCQDPYC